MSDGIGFRERTRRFGLGSAIQHGLWRRLHGVLGYARYVCLELPADAAIRAISQLDHVECRRVTPGEVPENPLLGLDKPFLDAASAHGDICIGVFVNGELASYSFNSILPTEFHPRLRYRFPNGWVYHFKAFTIPRWRGNHLHALNVAGVADHFRQVPGYRGISTLVLAANHSSLRSFERVGFRRVRSFVVLGRESATPFVVRGLDGAPNHVEHIKVN